MMLTFLSRSIRQLVSTSSSRRPGAGARPQPASVGRAAETSVARAGWAAPACPASSTAGAVRDRDISIAAPAPRRSAAFVAGEGARLYSLDAFRQGRVGSGAPTPAAPRAA